MPPVGRHEGGSPGPAEGDGECAHSGAGRAQEVDGAESKVPGR